MKQIMKQTNGETILPGQITAGGSSQAGQKPINKPLLFEPHGDAAYRQKPWGASSFCDEGAEYWAEDNGNWDLDPQNSGPVETQETAANLEESRRIGEFLNDDARAVLRANGFEV